jgi:hypothetical protein
MVILEAIFSPERANGFLIDWNKVHTYGGPTQNVRDCETSLGTTIEILPNTKCRYEAEPVII